jgi:lipopolysaccharide transport system permease protein
MPLHLWRWRRLVLQLARREFRGRYAGSMLGAAWAVLEPAVQFGLYLLLFSVFLGMRLESSPGVGSFGLYLVAGLIPYLALQEAVMQAVGFARGNAGMIRHVQAPIEVLLAGPVLAIFARYAIAFALVVVVAAAAGTVVWSLLPWLIIGVVLLVVLAWGCALALLPAGAFVPDLVQVVGTATTVFFFLTPIVYPESVLPRAVRGWIVLNPIVGLVDTFRAGLVGTEVMAIRLTVTIAAAFIVLVVGALVFASRSQRVRDLV